MRTFPYLMQTYRDGREVSCDTVLMGRLGSELALIYRDTLDAPLPPRLRSIVERLDEHVLGRREDDEFSAREGLPPR